MNFLEPLALESVSSIVWPLCRIGGFLMAMFAIGGGTIPTRVRALFTLAMTVCMLPSIPKVDPSLQPFTVLGIVTTINQVIIGVGIGLMTQFLAQAFVIAGQIVAMQTGLGFASLVDPVSGTNAPVVGQFFTVLVTLVFFAVDGHLLFFRLLLMSFETMPIGPESFDTLHVRELISFGTVMFQCAIAMSISAICTMLVVNFTFGVMTKAAPQLNVFSMGFAVSMIVGFFVLVLALDAFMGNFYIALNAISERTCSLIGTSCEGPY